MPDDKTTSARPHTELRRQERPASGRKRDADPVPPAPSGPSVPPRPRVPEDRLPRGDEDDLFNDIPV